MKKSPTAPQAPLADSEQMVPGGAEPHERRRREEAIEVFGFSMAFAVEMDGDAGVSIIFIVMAQCTLPRLTGPTLG